jgi:hypothetical protein
VLPMMIASEAIKKGLLAFVQQILRRSPGWTHLCSPERTHPRVRSPARPCQRVA